MEELNHCLVWVNGFRFKTMAHLMRSHADKLLEHYSAEEKLLLTITCRNISSAYSIEFPDKAAAQAFVEKYRGQELPFVDKRDGAKGPSLLRVRGDRALSSRVRGRAAGELWSLCKEHIANHKNCPSPFNIGVARSRVLHANDGEATWTLFELVDAVIDGSSFEIKPCEDLAFFDITPEIYKPWIESVIAHVPPPRF